MNQRKKMVGNSMIDGERFHLAFFEDGKDLNIFLKINLLAQYRSQLRDKKKIENTGLNLRVWLLQISLKKQKKTKHALPV